MSLLLIVQFFHFLFVIIFYIFNNLTIVQYCFYFFLIPMLQLSVTFLLEHLNFPNEGQ